MPALAGRAVVGADDQRPAERSDRARLRLEPGDERREAPGLPGVVGVAERDHVDMAERSQPGRARSGRAAGHVPPDDAHAIRVDRLERAVVDHDDLVGLLCEDRVERLLQVARESADRDQDARAHASQRTRWPRVIP